MTVSIHPLGEATNAPALRFIESWNGADAYDRFGSAGIGGQEQLAAQLMEHRRPALVAVSTRHGVVGLLDHVRANGATHVGIVVDSRFRKLSIGTALVKTLLQSPSLVRPIIAECGHDNHAAVALLRGCWFNPVESDHYQITWCYA